tara:strand:- start:61 stop:1902 length:1842 start_codon:yes stop_codon:yes gene_type:complete
MASIVINAGGRPMQVDIPDFAMESTQENVLEGVQRLVTAITGLSASNQGQSSGEKQIEGAVDDLKTSLKQDLKNTYSAARDSRLGKVIGNASAGGMIKSMGQPGMMTSFMKTIGLGGLATSFGMVTGLAEKMSSVYSFAGDVGLSFGENVLGTSERLAEIGIQLDTFGDVVATNLGAMRELGDSTEDGSQRFIGLVEDFRNTTKEFGYFGMASGEMAEFMAEELDIRRKSMDQEQLRLYIQNDLNDAMVANFKEQRAMAKVTGQNVRERIRAQMAAQEDVRLQVAMQSMTSDQIENTRSAFGNLTKELGPAGEEIRNAIIQGIAVEGTEYTTAGGRMAQLDTTGNIAKMIELGISARESGASPTEINNQMAQLIQDFKSQADKQTLVTLGSVGGNQDAMKLLQMNLGINEAGVQIAEGRNNLMSEELVQRQKFVDAMTALTAELDVQKATGANLAIRNILNIAGGDANDMVQGVRDLVATTTDIMRSDITKGILDAVSTAFGEMTFGPFSRTFTGNNTEGGRGDAEQAYVLGEALKAIGVPAAVYAPLLAPQTAIAGVQGLKEMLQTTSPDSLNDDGTFNWDKIGEQLSGMAINGTQKFWDNMRNILAGRTIN